MALTVADLLDALADQDPDAEIRTTAWQPHSPTQQQATRVLGADEIPADPHGDGPDEPAVYLEVERHGYQPYVPGVVRDALGWE